MRRRPGGRGARRGARSVGPPSGQRRAVVEMERRPRRDKGSAAGGRGPRTRRVTDRPGPGLPSRLRAAIARLGRRAPCGRRPAVSARHYADRTDIVQRLELITTSTAAQVETSSYRRARGLRWTSDRMCVCVCVRGTKSSSPYRLTTSVVAGRSNEAATVVVVSMC